MPDRRDACIPPQPSRPFPGPAARAGECAAGRCAPCRHRRRPGHRRTDPGPGAALSGPLSLVLVSETPEPLAAAPLLARRVVRAALVDAGVELASGVRAGRLTHGRLALSDGSFLPADVALWAGGDAGSGFPRRGRPGLRCGRSRAGERRAAQRQPPLRLRRRRLRHATERSLGPSPLLSANLCRAASGRRLIRSLRRSLLPQVAFAILDLGGGRSSGLEQWRGCRRGSGVALEGLAQSTRPGSVHAAGHSAAP